jgi:hypothetical protein
MSIENLVEILLAEKNDFLKVRETLTRIGVAAKNQNILYQSCHILHKQGRYYIVHFKELFELDGKPSNMSDNDIARRNTIANLMAEWGLCKLVDAAKSISPVAPLSQIKILPHKEKADWQLVAKYNIGSKKRVEGIVGSIGQCAGAPVGSID